MSSKKRIDQIQFGGNVKLDNDTRLWKIEKKFGSDYLVTVTDSNGVFLAGAWLPSNTEVEEFTPTNMSSKVTPIQQAIDTVQNSGELYGIGKSFMLHTLQSLLPAERQFAEEMFNAGRSKQYNFEKYPHFDTFINQYNNEK